MTIHVLFYDCSVKTEYPSFEESIATVSMSSKTGDTQTQLVPLPENNVASRLIESMVQKHLTHGLVGGGMSHDNMQAELLPLSANRIDPARLGGAAGQSFEDMVRQKLIKDLEGYSVPVDDAAKSDMFSRGVGVYPTRKQDM